MRLQRFAPMVLTAPFALAFLIVIGVVAGERALDGDPFRGRELFSEKLCARCHAIWGHGGGSGPDISIAVAGKTRQELVGDFWNHTPRMIDLMARGGYAWPTLDRSEMADILSYLYYLRLFDEPADAAQGATAYTRMRCDSCHSVGGEGGSVGAALDRYSVYASPVVLAQAMWNAGPDMQPAQLGHGIPIPEFTGSEMADIQAYIRSRGVRVGRQEAVLQPLPDPQRGADVFAHKRCGVCHSSNGVGPDLSLSAQRLTLAEISGRLWNHSYAMGELMRDRGISFPHFENSEMADLIAYLYFLGYAGKEGDVRTGATLFREKGCGDCHGGDDPQGPNLAESSAATDPNEMAAAMWNHAPQMHEAMAERAVSWPTFEQGEMRDLAAHLRGLARESTGGPGGTD